MSARLPKWKGCRDEKTLGIAVAVAIVALEQNHFSEIQSANTTPRYYPIHASSMYMSHHSWFLQGLAKRKSRLSLDPEGAKKALVRESGAGLLVPP